MRPYDKGGAGLSSEEALDVLQLERDNLAYVGETVWENGWEVDFWKGEKIEGELDCLLFSLLKFLTGDGRDKYLDS